MADRVYPKSQLPIRRTSDFLPNVFRSDTNDKFLSGVVDPLVQPGVVEKLSGYVGRRFGKTYKGNDIYLDSDNTLRSRYQLEPGITIEKNDQVEKFYDYLDLKNMLSFFGNSIEDDSKTTNQEHYTWNPPIDWDKFINYREYFWVPSGPPSVAVYGQAQTVTSTYKVNTGIASTWVFTPDGATNNPDIKLYRGQTYKFKVNSPNESFYLRTNYDTGSLNYNPLITYFPGQLAVYDGKLWRAKVEISPADGSTIDVDSQDWELVDSNASVDTLIYSSGVTNNGVRVGELTFEVPQDSPDVLYYQSDIDPNRLGRFIIADIDSNTFLDVENEIIGKENYNSSNGVEFSNGMIVEFLGTVTPAVYAENKWLVEGVGDEIKLIKFSDLIPPTLTGETPEVLFDNEGFDTQPFDDATQYPAVKDYILINRASGDSNPWSRYNRWFHRSVLEYAFRSRGDDFDATEASRAKRPIIEFNKNIQLFNHGRNAKQTVDYVDDYTTDIFSTIEGSKGYNIDGEFLFEGARVLVVADTDSLANNKIYTVKFITHNNNRQITLQEATDSVSAFNDCVLVRRGTRNAGKMFHFNGTSWVRSQEKLTINQSPLFEAYDENGVSLSDPETYPVSSFLGTEILKYKIGNSVADKELGFSLSYLNIDNVGDIQFEWTWDKETFTYNLDNQDQTKNVNTAFYFVNGNYANGWAKLDNTYIQPIIDSVVLTQDTNEVVFNTIDWNNFTDNTKIIFYKNGEKVFSTYTRTKNTFVFDETFAEKDVISLKIVDSNIVPDQGYYEIPIGIERNPLNQGLGDFTLGQAVDHVRSGLEFIDSFTGEFVPGNSNLRDLSGWQLHAKRFIKHAGIAAASVAVLVDKQSNIIKSLQYSSKQYSSFKENFLKKALELEFEESIPDFVDRIIEDLTKTKTIDSPFSDSDMIGTGAFNGVEYTVEDPGIVTFTLSEKFDLSTLSRKAVYVYLNGAQLLHEKDYTFNSAFGFVTITRQLSVGDKIEIREYISTAFSHIPPTPAAMGLYKKYTPMKFTDDTYRQPREVIQGHDGSITVSYEDYRDDLLLELEYRIYNNIKNNYDPQVFDVDEILGGYYGNANFTKDEFDNIINQQFLRWVANTNLEYTTNSYFIENEPFTYTYSNMTDPAGTENLPGYWRGVYKYFYDTDRPHRCPWECLGFSEKPTWWEEEYGPAPYTSGNLILWEDIRDGIIRQGPRAGRYDRYARTSIMNHLPVNSDGELVNPLDSGLAKNFTLVNNRGSFKLGDISPTEYAWRSSSEEPYAMIIALCLLKPFDFIISNFDRAKTTRNILDQIVDIETKTFITPNELKLPVAGTNLVSGLSFYVTAYLKSNGVSVTQAQDIIDGLQVRLTSRLSGFVDKEQQKYILDSKNPSSSNSSIFVPQENYDIIFNVSAPIGSVTYSGVIIEKTQTGWALNGYDDTYPYFNYYTAVNNQKDPVMSVGGISQSFTEWQPQTKYNNGAIVEYRNTYYRAKQSLEGVDEFDGNDWVKLPELPLIDAITAQRRRNFNKTVVRKLSYGETLPTVQAVVDFLLGYQAYLIDQGIIFENYDPENQVVQDFVTACKEFMFWTKHNWAIGSLLTISPGAVQIRIAVPVGVADNILDGFYDYNVLKSDGTPIQVKNINVKRDFQNVTVSTVDTDDGIYYLKINFVLKEHVTVFKDKTVFNDIIFDKPTGYRQERIKTQGFRTIDWDGDYTSPGFLFDNVKIESWSPFTDYRLGDIIQYKTKYFTSRYNHTSDKEFNDDNWTILDSNPEKQLIANFDYRVNQIEDYFNVGSQGLGKSQRDLARHTIGYQQRQYLQYLAEDEVTQYKLYQGFIREKGTNNSITKLFNKISKSGQSSVSLEEEWAFRVGQFGGIDQTNVYEIKLDTEEFVLNPQPILVVDSKPNQPLDRYYRVNKSDFYYAPVPYTTEILPTTTDQLVTRTAGYVKTGQTAHVVKNKSDILNINIEEFNENDHVWITFNNLSWTVLRGNVVYDLPVDNISSKGTIVTVTFGKKHNLVPGDIIGITNIEGIIGFHEIVELTQTIEGTTLNENLSIQFIVDPAPEISFDASSLTFPILFTEARFADYDSLQPEHVALLRNNSKLFVDKNADGLWEVVQKKKQYQSKKITNYGITDPVKTGYKVEYASNYKQVIASIPGSGYVNVYIETNQGLSVRQILEPQSGLETTVNGSFGYELSLSPDQKYLFVGSPLASGVTSNYKGLFSPYATYAPGDIVLYAGNLWKSLTTNVGDGSTIDLENNDWELTKNISALSSGSETGPTQQGAVSVYEWNAQQWNYVESFVSPRPNESEKFGSKIVCGKTANGYTLAISAPGSINNKGRVYLYTQNTDGEWELIEDENYKGIYNSGVAFTGSINDNVLTVTDVAYGKIVEGAILEGSGITAGTKVVSQTQGIKGSTGTYTVVPSYDAVGSNPAPIGSTAITGTYYYPTGSIVYVDGFLWKATANNYSDGSTISIQSADWLKVDEIATQSSLPQSMSIEDDGSTLSAGILSDTQISELIKDGDRFGMSLSMNYDGSVLVVGAPYADGQFFTNFKGPWDPNYEYVEGDVVKYQGGYHKLINAGPTAVGIDSTIRSYNQEPDAGLPWSNVGDSSAEATGKIFIYRKDINGFYKLDQTITTEGLEFISDIDPSETISTGDQFGYDMDIDYSGNTLVVSSPKADRNFQNQGSAYIFKYESDSSELQFRLKQKIESYDIYPNEYFGQSVCITPNTEKLVVGANNSPYSLPTRFDSSTTTFDDGVTSFKSYDGFSGAVYVFERKDETYFLAEKLDEDLSLNESFGFSLVCDTDTIVVGSPDYIEPAPHGPGLAFEGSKVGNVRLFKKQSGINSLELIGQEEPTVDIRDLKRLTLYSDSSTNKIQDIEIIDPAKMRILAAAEREITFKTLYDPAVYSVGNPDNQIVDSDTAWTTKNVGKLWWNISTVKWVYYEQGDTAYRTANWGKLAEGSTIEVSEWVETKLLPSEWAVLADTTEGLKNGISGTPLYDDSVYSIKELFNVNTGELTETLYYYWVKSKVTVPNISGRTISAANVGVLIADPNSLGNTFTALIAKDKFLFYNYTSLVNENSTILNFEFYKNSPIRNEVHNEYQLITEDVADSVPTPKLERKMIDSLVGYDIQGNRVPDPDLPEKQKYGIKFRPRQSMFTDRRGILKIIIENANKVLQKQPFANIISFENLNLKDEQPSNLLRLYDTSVSNYIDLETVGTVRTKAGQLSVNIIDDEISSIDVVDPGFGYKVAPNVEFEGDGEGAVATTTIDNQGRITSVTVNNPGRNYKTAIAKVRRFSVLVETDSTSQNYWSIYAWDDIRQTFFRSASQAFDTTKYWSYIDWWKEGYSETTRIIKEIPSVAELPANEESISVGDLIRFKEYGSGDWAVFKKISDTSTSILSNYELVGRKNGTIKLENTLYDVGTTGIGYDNVTSFDTNFYDREPINELRNIFTALKQDVFVGDYTVEWNKLFFSCVRYVLHEQVYVDWAFKTSFLNATHTVGELLQTPNYKNDSLDQYLNYIDEVKPYRTTIREYVSKYDKTDYQYAGSTDFDLPPAYLQSRGKITRITEIDPEITEYPYKWWLDNKGFSVTEVLISNPGSGYTSVPRVVIEGDGTGAKGQAYVSNGTVSGVVITNPGSGYTVTPTIALVGGNGSSTDKAKAVAVLGDTKARVFNLAMKFDRITKEGLYSFTDFEQTFTATGTTSVFELKYAPTRDKSKIQIIKNGEIVLNSEYSITIYRSNDDEFKILKGKVVFNETPTAGDIIEIEYEKNDELLDAVNRINKLYNPVSGMKGNDLDQLMTGIDFGGVQVQGTTFDVTGGWDALPWFTDSWDSVEAASDYYHVCDGSTEYVELPYVPTEGQRINIYLKRAGEEVLPTIDNLQYGPGVKSPPIRRIDSPYFLDGNDSSTGPNPNAEMPTFVGDGSTKTVEIGIYITTNDGDILIFRPETSDGSVTITDDNLVDTNISGGSLSIMEGAYATATGKTAEEINLEGGRFIGPEQVPATEENIPGQVLDSLSIKVYTAKQDGVAPLSSRVAISDGSTTVYDIGQTITENKSVIVYIDGLKTSAYTVNVQDNTVEFASAPASNSKIEILSIGIGGVTILDYQEFKADGDTGLFLTNANYDDTANIFVSVNGIQVDVGYINSSDVLDTPNRTLVQFGEKPSFNSVIKIVVLGSSTDVDSSSLPLVRVNQQTIIHDGSTRNYDLDNFVSLERASAKSSMIVEVNDVKLKGVDTTYFEYDGVTNNFTLGQDPLEAAGAILSRNLRVFINNELKTFVQDYVYNGSTKVLTLTAGVAQIGDIIKIENDLRSEYNIVGGNLVIGSGVTLNPGDEINVTWFSEYPSMDVYSDRTIGGKVYFELPFKPISASYVWVYKNGVKLIQDVDYQVKVDRGIMYLTDPTTTSDVITITIFGTSVFRNPSAYEINKDMLNIYRFNRYSKDANLTLAKNLNYYDLTIEVTDGSMLSEPIRQKNIPGVILINNERIEYLQKDGNILSQLRRGSQGTSIKELHSVGSYLIDVSQSEYIPYQEENERMDFVSDGSSLLIGPLGYVPAQSTDANWYAGTIPQGYGRCDTVEVFAAGRRLRKVSLTVFDETLGAVSPDADRQIEAEFSVDGTSQNIRLTETLPAGTRITVIKKVGKTWYDRGETTASTGVTLLENTTPISKFIAAKSTRLPE